MANPPCDLVTDSGALIRFGPGIGIRPKLETGDGIMMRNVGGIDRIARVAVGALLIVLALAGVVGWWGWIGVVPLVTGLMSWCPLYTAAGLNTCPRA